MAATTIDRLEIKSIFKEAIIEVLQERSDLATKIAVTLGGLVDAEETVTLIRIGHNVFKSLLEYSLNFL